MQGGLLGFLLTFYNVSCITCMHDLFFFFCIINKKIEHVYMFYFFINYTKEEK